MKIVKLSSIFILSLLIYTSLLPFSKVSAQIQFFDFSGNSAESYQCFDERGIIIKDSQSIIYKDDISGYFLCEGVNNDGIAGDDRAVLIPPTLQQIEVWFVRILYVVWAVVGAFSFILLVGVGFEYMLRGGTSDQELVKVRKRIINYIIGFALVFLAVPILTTVFNLLGVNDDVACYDVNMPGFQFFFTTLCTGTEAKLQTACTSNTVIEEGQACGKVGETVTCQSLFPEKEGVPSVVLPDPNRYFICATGRGTATNNVWVDSKWASDLQDQYDLFF